MSAERSAHKDLLSTLLVIPAKAGIQSLMSRLSRYGQLAAYDAKLVARGAIESPFFCWLERSGLGLWLLGFRKGAAYAAGVSIACRRSSHFSLLAQRKVTQRNGL